MTDYSLSRIPPKEIKEVIDWCEKRKKEEMRVPLIEPNPFKHLDWMRNKTVIQIDREKEVADKNGIVYDSTTRSLYEHVNGVWKKIE